MNLQAVSRGDPAVPEAQDFAALLSRARQGDEGALAELARQYEPEIRAVARVLLGPALRPHLDSVDIAQSVHRSLLIGLRAEKFDLANPKALVALALTLVRRKVARHWRKLQRQQRLSGRPADSANLPDLLANLASPEADPGQAAAYHEAVQQVCRDLDETERRLLDLRLQGFSTAEAARDMGLDPDVVRVRLFRLRQRLRDQGVLGEWL